MIARISQIVLMGGAAGLSYWGWPSLNFLRGTPLFEYRYVILLTVAILLFSVAQAIAAWIDAHLSTDDH